MAFGAAGRSVLRDRALMQPAQPTAIKVNPAPVTVADKATLSITGGDRSFGSVWRASQARAAVPNVDAAGLQVVELAELVA